MKTSTRSLLRFLVPLPLSFHLILLAGSSHGQSQPPPTPAETAKPAIFPQIFAKYSGANGYEDLVIAGDILQSSKASEHEDEILTLAQKRKALQDPDIARALNMVHDAVQKPIFQPRNPNKIDQNTLFPEYGPLRKLSRFIAMKEYVFLADGNTGAAIDTMFDGMKMGRGVQGGTIISGLVGIAIDSIALNPIARRYDQLSTRNCDQILVVVREALEWGGGASETFKTEESANLKLLESFRDSQKFKDFIAAGYFDPLHPTESELTAAAATQPLRNYIDRNPNGINALIDKTIPLVKRHFAEVQNSLKQPYFNRKKQTEPDPNSSIEALLYSNVIGVFDQVVKKYAQLETMFHLLGTHASIMKYQWNHRQLPESLEALREDRLYAPEIITDPFSGKPLIYKVIGGSYDLHSVGSPDDGDYYLPYRPKLP